MALPEIYSPVFEATTGEDMVGNASPEKLTDEFGVISVFLDPSATHGSGNPGGIHKGNLTANSGIITEDNIGDQSVAFSVSSTHAVDATTSLACSGNSATSTTGPASSVGFLYLKHNAPYNGTALSRNEGSSDSSSWLTVGPTGSGASVIWTELDSLPAGARSVKINLEAKSSHLSASAGSHYISAFIRENGSGASPASPCVMAFTYAANHIIYDHNTVEVALDSNKMFELEWTKIVAAGGTLNLNIYLEAYSA